MIGRARVLVALDASVDRETVQAVLPATPPIELLGVVEGLDEGWAALERQPVDLVIVVCGEHGDYAMSFVEGTRRHYPDRPVVLLHSGNSNGFVSRAFSAGADDIVAFSPVSGGTVPEEQRERVRAELLFALEKALARRDQRAAGVATARMVTVLGPKGGAGKTLVACSLAVTLADAGQRVALVDLDLQFGDVGLALGLPPGRTIHDLATSGGSLDEEKLDAFLAPHESAARVLLAPARPDHATAISVEFLRDLYHVLRRSHDWVIVDTAPGFTAEVIASVDCSTDLCMVGMLDSLSLKNTKLGLETLDLMGFPRERVVLVLNRADSRVGITREDVQAVTGRPPDVLVPSHRDIPRSVNEAQPIVRSQPGSNAARALRSIAEGYMGVGGQASPRRRRRLLPIGRRA